MINITSMIAVMRQKFNWRKIAKVVAVLLLLIWSINEIRIRFPIRSHSMNEYTKNLKTVCVGRYLWDVPQAAVIGTISQKINGIEIERMPERALTDVLFDMQMTIYQIKLKAELGKLDFSGITEVIPFAKNGKIIIFKHESPTEQILNAHAYVGVGEAIYKLTSKFDIDYKSESVADLEKVAASLRPRSSNEIPTEPGLCIDGAFAAGKGFESEETIMDFELKNWTGFGMSLNSSYAPNINNNPDYENRIDRIERQRYVAMFIPALKNISVTRKAAVQLAGSAGREMLFANDIDGDKSLNGIAESMGDGTYQHQSIEVGMSNSAKGKGSAPVEKLDDETAISIWDAVIKSIRLRP